MQLDLTKTIVVFAAVVLAGVASLFALPELTPMTPMATDTILMMVAPSMAIFGALTLAIGVKHGEYRASH